MFGNMLSNLPQVTKNLLIINVLFFLARFVFMNQGIYLDEYLAMHYPASPKFMPHQIITAFFMHGSIGHIFMNMIGLVFMGSHLERFWGAKRYLIFYVVCAIGGTLCSTIVEAIHVHQITGSVWPDVSMAIDYFIEPSGSVSFMAEFLDPGSLGQTELNQLARVYATSELGASGALYGVLMAFAVLFPNTEFMLLFPPIPIKAKWLAVIFGGIALYSGLTGTMEGIGHFAHLGGMLFGFLMIKYWQRNRTNFY